jgi:hypothetical protein
MKTNEVKKRLVKKLVVKTRNPKTILDMMNEMGTSFYCEGEDKDEYCIIYFATNREVYFEGKLDARELEQVKTGSHRVNSIKVDALNQEIIIEET